MHAKRTEFIPASHPGMADPEHPIHIISLYLAEKASTRRFASTTLKTARQTLIQFAGCCPDTFTKTTRRHVMRWFDTQATCATSTVAQRYGMVRAFTRWANANGRLPKDPCASITGPKAPRRQPRALDPADVMHLLDTAPTPRVRLAVSLMVCEGARLSEVSKMQIADLNWRHMTIDIVHGKGDKSRTVHMTPTTAAAIAAYLAEYPAASGPLIRSVQDPTRAISSQHLGRIVTDHFRAAGVKGWNGDGRSPHALRHTFASDLCDAGMPLPSVSELMGHANIATTQVYLRHVNLASTREAVEARPYAGGLRPVAGGGGLPGGRIRSGLRSGVRVA